MYRVLYIIYIECHGGVDVIKSSHKDPGVKPPGPGQPPKAPEEKGKDFNLKNFKNFFSMI